MGVFNFRYIYNKQITALKVNKNPYVAFCEVIYLYTTMANIERAISGLDKNVAQLKAKSQTTFESVNKLEQSVEFNASDIADLKRDLLRSSNL